MDTVAKSKREMTTIPVQKSTAKKLQDLYRVYGDTYDVVILRLLNGRSKPEKRGITGEHE